MRRIRVLCLLGLLFATVGVLFADYEVRGKDVFAVSRSIAKIYASRFGYKVLFYKGSTDIGVFYVPLEWFEKAGGKGEIVWGGDTSYPTFTAFYMDGKFSHIRLYLISDIKDPTWDVLSASDAEQKKFEIDTLEIKY
jgi:hypothetical protein